MAREINTSELGKIRKILLAAEAARTSLDTFVFQGETEDRAFGLATILAILAAVDLRNSSGQREKVKINLRESEEVRKGFWASKPGEQENFVRFTWSEDKKSGTMILPWTVRPTETLNLVAEFTMMVFNDSEVGSASFDNGSTLEPVHIWSFGEGQEDEAMAVAQALSGLVKAYGLNVKENMALSAGGGDDMLVVIKKAAFEILRQGEIGSETPSAGMEDGRTEGERGSAPPFV